MHSGLAWGNTTSPVKKAGTGEEEEERVHH